MSDCYKSGECPVSKPEYLNRYKDMIEPDNVSACVDDVSIYSGFTYLDGEGICYLDANSTYATLNDSNSTIVRYMDKVVTVSNILEEVKKLVNLTNYSVTKSFDCVEEGQSYLLGVDNTLSALESVLDSLTEESGVVVHMPSLKETTEMTLEEIAEKIE